MTFGRRGQIKQPQPAPPAAIASNAGSVAQDIGRRVHHTWLALPLWARQIGSFVAMVAGVFVAATFVVPASLWLPGSITQEQPARTLSAKGGDVTIGYKYSIADVDPLIVPKRVQTFRRCNAAARAVDPVYLSWVGNVVLDAYTQTFDATQTNGNLQLGYLRANAFLHCMMTTDHARFCESGERKRLVAMLEEHAEAHGLIVAHLRRSQPTGGPIGGLFSLVSADLSDDDTGVVSRRNISSPYPGALADALVVLNERGFLLRSDFSRAAPHTLTSLLEGNSKRYCP